MADIRVVWSNDLQRSDYLRLGRTLDGTRELATAVGISLLTDRLANDDDTLPDGTTNRRGCWSDYDAADIWGAPPWGSRLWLLVREKQTEETRARADEYIREALAWMTQLRVAERVDVETWWYASGKLAAAVTMYRGRQGSIEIRFEKLWDDVLFLRAA